jgi:hypothetical protein
MTTGLDCGGLTLPAMQFGGHAVPQYIHRQEERDRHERSNFLIEAFILGDVQQWWSARICRRWIEFRLFCRSSLGPAGDDAVGVAGAVVAAGVMALVPQYRL